MRILCLDHHPQLTQRELQCIDAIEWRLDAENSSIAQIKEQNQQWKKPWILTHRRKQDGGRFVGTNDEHQKIVLQALALEPNWVDVEHDQPDSFLTRITQDAPRATIIRSRHDLDETPEDLEFVLKSLQHPLVKKLKWVTKANRGSDGIRMLLLSQQNPQLTAFCLGEKGRFTRMLAPKWGADDYLCRHRTVAEGQLSLVERINHPVSPTTKCFAVIGCPIQDSFSPLWHHLRFQLEQQDAIYTAIEATADDIHVPNWLWDLNVHGLSITMPLKRHWAQSPWTSVNTYARSEKGWLMTNTDKMAITELFRNHNPQRFLVLGAGATGIMCIEALKDMGHHPVLCHFKNEKAKELAKKHSIEHIEWENLELIEDFYCVVSALPFTVNHQPWEKKLKPHQYYLNLNYRHTPTTKAQLISGLDFFTLQAQSQQQFWRAHEIK